MLINIAMFFLASLGATKFIVDKPFSWPRTWLSKVLSPFFLTLITCHQCTGMWAGMIFGAMLISTNLFIIFGCGCCISLLATFMASFLNYVDAHSIVNLEKYEK